MKITKDKLKQIIKEEIQSMAEIKRTPKQQANYEKYLADLERSKIAREAEFEMPKIEDATLKDMQVRAREETSSKRGYKSYTYEVWTSNNPGESDDAQVEDIRNQIQGMPGGPLGYYRDEDQVFAYVKYSTF